MANDPVTVDRLQAELRALRALNAASQQENAVLRESEAALLVEVSRSRVERDTLAEEQAATREILRAIATMPADLDRVLHTVAQSAARLPTAIS
jgi:hypothetical protein